MQVRNIARVALITTIVSLSCFTLGCGGSGEFTTYPVSGKIEYNGKPMAGGGSIAFMPVSNQKGKMAGGVIAEDGSFVMSTYGDGDGSIPGEFRVVIHQTTVREPDFAGDGSESEAGAAGETVSVADQIPAVYSDQFNSPLTVKVEPTAQNNLTLVLEKK